MNQPRLYRFLWLSIAAAVATIALKTAAWLITGSVGLLSDAAESIVNLVAAVVAPAALPRGFASVHILVPGEWSLQRAHDLAEEVEPAIRRRLPYVTVFTHVESLEDPRSFVDRELDRDVTLDPSR